MEVQQLSLVQFKTKVEENNRTVHERETQLKAGCCWDLNCSLTFTSKDKLSENLVEKYNKTLEPDMNQDEKTERTTTKLTKIVLVLLRSLAWPFEVLTKENHILEVKNQYQYLKKL